MDQHTPAGFDGYFGSAAATPEPATPAAPQWQPAPPLPSEPATMTFAAAPSFAPLPAAPAPVVAAPAPPWEAAAAVVPPPTAAAVVAAPVVAAPVVEASVAFQLAPTPAVAPAPAAPAAVPAPTAMAPVPAPPVPPAVPAPTTLAPQASAAPSAGLVPEQPRPAAASGAPVEAKRVGAEDNSEDSNFLSDLLVTLLETGGSDLHLTVGARPTVRGQGSLRQLEDFPVLTPLVIQRTLYAILSQKQREKFEETLELDFAYSLPGRARFRVNIYQQKDSLGAAFRVIPYEIKKLEDLGVPAQVAAFAMLPRGFVLVTGPTGSGKSTTLASVVDMANRSRNDHIMTVEDPIEFLHEHKKLPGQPARGGGGHPLVQERAQARAASGPGHHPGR